MNFESLIATLKERGYMVSCFATAAQAAEYLDAQIDGKTVGFGGSVTLQQLQIYEKLNTHNQVSWHQQIPDGKTAQQLREEASRAQVYLSSVNALAETGEIIHIDGNCNRVASVLYGHEKVYLVVGVNKIAPDYERALFRARNIAAPLNAKRLGRKTPCAVNADRCYDCNSPERICCALSVLWKKPMSGEYEVVLIDQPLGY